MGIPVEALVPLALAGSVLTFTYGVVYLALAIFRLKERRSAHPATIGAGILLFISAATGLYAVTTLLENLS